MKDYTVKTLPDVVLTDHLRAIIDRLDASTADIETCITLPSEVYTSEAWFEFEKRAVWDREWVCLGHIGQVPKAGDYFSITINNDPLLVLRDDAGEVRVMTAVCQHRGHILGEHAGNTHVFTCPHHGWSYDLSGTLISAPQMDAHASLEELRRTSCLPTLRTEIWNGFVFINMDGNAPPLNPRLKRLSKEIANHHLGDMGATPTCDFSGYPWNWKAMQENAVEPHHTWFVHKGPHDFAPSRLASFVEWDDDDDGAVYHPTGFLYKDGGFTAGFQSLFPIIETLTDAERQRVMFASVLPNLFIGTVPDGCLYYMILPDGANRLTLRVGYLFPHSTLALDNFDITFKAVVDGIVVYNDQDTEANTAVHRGLRSRFANRGRYAPLEGTLPQINRWLVKRYKAYAAELNARAAG